jgi:hypothetical protein
MSDLCQPHEETAGAAIVLSGPRTVRLSPQMADQAQAARGPQVPVLNGSRPGRSPRPPYLATEQGAGWAQDHPGNNEPVRYPLDVVTAEPNLSPQALDRLLDRHLHAAHKPSVGAGRRSWRWASQMQGAVDVLITGPWDHPCAVPGEAV